MEDEIVTQMYWPVETGIASCVSSINTFFFFWFITYLHFIIGKKKSNSQIQKWFSFVFKHKLSQLKFSFSKTLFKMLKLFYEKESDYALYCCVKIKLISVTMKLFSATWISLNISWLLSILFCSLLSCCLFQVFL